MTIRRRTLVATMGVSAIGMLPLRAARAAEPVTYSVVGLVDYLGPFADIAGPVISGRDAVLRWWNAEVGAELGVNLKVKNFDTRSDSAQAASLWPSISAEKPISIMSLGSADALALRDRTIEAQVPLFIVGALPSGVWSSDGWLISLRPSYAHESAALFDKLYATGQRSKPIKVAVLSSEAVPGYVEIVKGLTSYAKTYGRIEVAPIWDAAQPTDLTAQMQRAVKSGVEYLVVQTNTAAVVATARALQALGANIPLVLSSHNGLLASGRALNDMKALENSYEVHVLPIPAGDTPQKKFYDLLVAKYGYKSDWTPLAAQGIVQGLLTVRAIELAARKFGTTGLSGAKVRDAYLGGELKVGFGFSPGVQFTRSTPFPEKGLTVSVAMIKDGHYVLKYTDVPVPELKKW